MKTIVVLSQTGSLMPEFAAMTADALSERVKIEEYPDQPFLALSHLLEEHVADLYLLGYPHTDHAQLFGNIVSDTCDVTQGANVLVRQPEDQRLDAHDTRPQGLAYALRHLDVSAERVLVIGKESPAFAAALACSSNNIVDIDIVNPGGFGKASRRWRGVRCPEGKYNLVINTMCLEGNLPIDILLEGQPTVVDLVQGRGAASALLVQASTRGCQTIGPVLPAALRTYFALCRLYRRKPSEAQFVAQVRAQYGI